MTNNKQIALISLTSGAVSVAGFLILKRIFSSKLKIIEQRKKFEEKEMLDTYMVYHYAHSNDLLLFDLNEKTDVTKCFSFPKKVVLFVRENCSDLFYSNSMSRPLTALDVGCAVGRSCFELSKLFDAVIGVDSSVNFIRQCNKILQAKKIEFEGRLEGDLYQRLRIRLDPNVDTSKISFEVGDPCNLRKDIGKFDLVLASNLLEKLEDPMKFINRLKYLVKPNGYVILSTSFTWLESFTPKKNWLGGYVKSNGDEVSGLFALKNALDDSFSLNAEINQPMFMRHTQREFSYAICSVTIWKRR